MKDLNDDWKAADQMAIDLRITSYGVLVAKDLAAGFMVLVQDENPEDMFTKKSCK